MRPRLSKTNRADSPNGGFSLSIPESRKRTLTDCDGISLRKEVRDLDHLNAARLQLLNLTYPPCLTPPQDRSRSRHRDRRRDCPQPSGTGGQLAQPGLTPVPGRFEDSVVVVTRSTRGADRSLDLDRSDPDYQFAHNFTKTLENHDLVRLKDSPAGTEMHPPIAALDLISQGITQRTSPGHSPTHPRTMNTYTP